MITISPGHWAIGTGAVGIIDEVEEARRVVRQVCSILEKHKITVHEVIDKQSTNQQQNLHYLISEHNKTERKIDISVHFNSIGGKVNRALGCEVYYRNPAMKVVAQRLSMAIATASSLRDRGAKRRDNLAFLNKTKKPALLIEVCFVNSELDVRLYNKHFYGICDRIAEILMEYVKVR